jgi:phosphate-selective porin OprO and OprP
MGEWTRVRSLLIGCVVAPALSSVVLAQPPATAPLPAPAPSAPAPAPPVNREVALEERLRKLEAMNQKILQQYEAMEQRHNERYAKLSQEFKSLQERLKAESESRGSGDDPAGDEVGPDSEGTIGRRRPIGPNQPSGAEGTIGRGTLGVDTGGTTGRPGTTAGRAGAPRGEPIGSAATRGPQGTISRTREGESRPGRFTIGRGLRFTSEDDEFQLIFHDLTQAEIRNFPGAGDQSPLHTQFFIPRQRWYFAGRATKDVEYYTVINRGYGSLDLLDAFIDFKYLGPKFVLRTGRTKTPVSYEYYQIAEGDLIAPERSIYTGNLSGNRQNGMMLHGRILDERSEYALGVFNGPRRSFQDFNNDKDVFMFFNIRPFEKSETLKALNIMNFGGEFDYGNQNNTLQPNIFTTANDQSSTTSDVTVQSLSPTFFQFNNNVVEKGTRTHHAAWIAWYYKSFNLLVQYDGGFQDYALGFSGTRHNVPQTGYFAQAYYFLTGEQIKRRVDVTPNRNFTIKNGRITGPGAWEVHARYAYFNIGRDAFTTGLADPNLWTNQVGATDLGVNWYPNQYTKIYFDWQHSIFGDAVFNGPRAFHGSADLVWLRFQLFF